jgi:dihydrofolate reductase
MANPSHNPIGAALITMPKYVVSTTLTDPQWKDTTVLSGDVAAEIGELKAKSGGELQVHGSGKLVRWLLDNDRVDEMNVLICPVIVGQGTRLFPDTGPERSLELVQSRSTPGGVAIQVYRPTGRPEYGDGTFHTESWGPRFHPRGGRTAPSDGPLFSRPQAAPPCRVQDRSAAMGRIRLRPDVHVLASKSRARSRRMASR